jgi:GcrA cell cycle regulator
MLWTNEETRELVSLWPTHSTLQIARQLHRPRSAVAGKVKRLRQEGALPQQIAKHYEIKPVQARPPRSRKAPVLIGTVPYLGMRPCTLHELDDSRCRWPLGEVREVATMFCGDAAVTDCPYCAHHLRMARSHGSVP